MKGKKTEKVEENPWESVKIRKKTVSQVREHIKDTGQTISGFFSTLATDFLKKNK